MCFSINSSRDVIMISVEETLKYMQLYEGFEIQEAKLTYKAREKLPDSAFCGPNRTYPAHDAAHVRSGLQRLSQFGHRLPKAVRAKILGCLKRKAKAKSVEVSETYKWNKDGSLNIEVHETAQSKVAWYLKELGIK